MNSMHGCSLIFLLTSIWANHAGEFVNLDFEAALVPPTAPGQIGGEVDPALAFPGWKVGTNGFLARNYTLHNNVTLGSVQQVLVGPEFPSAFFGAPLQGSYSALLQYGPSESLGLAALSQTGTVPAAAKYISFMVDKDWNDAHLTIAGEVIPLVETGTGRMAGEISRFAGQEVELMFSNVSPIGPGFYFDDVQFTAEMNPPTSRPRGPTISSKLVVLSSDPDLPEVRLDLTWDTVPGRTYQLQTSETLNGPWFNLGQSFKAWSTNSGYEKFEVPWEEPGYERLEPQRFFRVQVTP